MIKIRRHIYSENPVYQMNSDVENLEVTGYLTYTKSMIFKK
jgi:hypothetical protein